MGGLTNAIKSNISFAKPIADFPREARAIMTQHQCDRLLGVFRAVETLAARAGSPTHRPLPMNEIQAAKRRMDAIEVAFAKGDMAALDAALQEIP